MKVRLAPLALLVLAAACTAPAQSAPEAPPDPDIGAFLPVDARLLQQVKLSFEPRGVSGIALSYGWDTEPYVRVGVRVLSYGPVGWKTLFSESASLINGAGAEDAIRIETIKSQNGREGLVVVLKNSGAGTATDWHVLAFDRAMTKLDSLQIRDKVLKQKGYVFMGYNGVTVKEDLVIENIPGYSPGTARCCPDKPSINISSRFTGNALKLTSVKELPIEPRR